jgi:hypothetical protein
MFRDDFRFARVQTQVLRHRSVEGRTCTDTRHSRGQRFRRRRILVGSAQTCQGRRPSLGRANGDAGMTHLVFRVDAAPTSGTPKRQDKKRAGSSRYYTRSPRRHHRMKTFPDRSSLPLWLAPAVRARPALESLEGPHEENVSQRDSGRGVARSAG